MIQPFLLQDLPCWVEVRDANATARDIFHRHYSRYIYKDGRNPAKFVGPGEHMVLLSNDVRALFVWRKYQSKDCQQGINCAIFRNEGAGVASELIRAADILAWKRWPGERLFTYVNPRKVEKKRQPGRCFLKAGWRYLRKEDGSLYTTKARNLLVLETREEWAV